MSSSPLVTDKTSVVIVSLNITETNNTSNRSKLAKSMISPKDDSSFNNIIFGIGLAVVIVLVLLVVAKLFYKCYKIYQADDTELNKSDPSKKLPLLPTSSNNVTFRNTSVRNPRASIHRSSLPIETQMDLRQKRNSQAYTDTPPSAIKKP